MEHFFGLKVHMSRETTSNYLPVPVDETKQRDGIRRNACRDVETQLHFCNKQTFINNKSTW